MFYCRFSASTSTEIWRLTKLDQPKSAIVFSYNDRRAHLQLFTSRCSVFSEHGIVVGVVVISTGTLCHACVLCSGTSVGQAELAGPGADHLSFTEHWKHAVCRAFTLQEQKRVLSLSCAILHIHDLLYADLKTDLVLKKSQLTFSNNYPHMW